MGIAAALFFSGCREAKFVKRTSADPDKQARLDWSYRTSVEVYQKSSFKGYRWNQFAVNALAEFACVRSGVFASNEPCAAIISSNAAAAIRAGCKDPLVN